MKGKISKILGVSLALVLGFSLITAVPVAADSPDVGYTLVDDDGDGGTATWSTNFAHSGSYSVELSSAAAGAAFAVPYAVRVPYGEPLDTITNADFTYWYSKTETPGSFGVLYIDSGGGDTVDKALLSTVSATSVSTGTWTETPQYDLWNEYPCDADCTVNLPPIEWKTLADWQAEYEDATLLYVGVAWGTIADVTIYIDDITINGTTYELEPIFLDKPAYGVGDTVEVTVPNFAANTDSIRVNPVAANCTAGVPNDNWNVTVISSSDPEGITVDLEETGANTGVFTGSFATTGTTPAGEDEVYVQEGDTIAVTYLTSDPWWGAGDGSASPTTITATVDETAPTITIVSPLDGATTEDATPEIKATYTDATAGIDATSVEMLLNGVDVTDDATADGAGVTYTPTEDLADGSHDVTVNVSDNAGNAATKSWSFRIVSWLETDSVDCDSELDALGTVGVAVSITGDTAKIEVGRYASNPEPDAALTFSTIEDGFFDVKVTACENNGDTLVATQVVIKFADPAITAEPTAYVFDDLQGMWLACSDQGYNPTDEFLWVKVREADTTPNISELGGTPFAISGVWDPMVYDVDGSGVIEKDEALTAVADYFDLEITKDQVLEVIALYFG